MKTDFYVETNGEQVSYNNIVNSVKNIWKADGKLVKDLKTLELYLKPVENRCYYVINNDIKGYIAV